MSEELTVLLIDDDTAFLEMVEYTLLADLFVVKKADNGPDGIAIAKNKKSAIDVILLDTSMPEMNGLQVLQELKKDKHTRDIPVFMLTGKSTMGDVEKAFDLNADDYLTKPVELPQLGDIIKNKLEKYRMKNK